MENCDCKNGNNLGSTKFIVTIKDGHLLFEYNAYSTDSSFEDEIKINYCPLCGVKLKSRRFLIQKLKQRKYKLLTRLRHRTNQR